MRLFPEEILEKCNRLFADFQRQLRHLQAEAGETKKSLISKGLINANQYVHAFNYKTSYSGNASLGLMIMAANALGYDIEINFRKQGPIPHAAEHPKSSSDQGFYAKELRRILLDAIERLHCIAKIYDTPAAKIFAQDICRALTFLEAKTPR